MSRRYRRPGVARSVEDIFASYTERRNSNRRVACARRDRLNKFASRMSARHNIDQIELMESPEDRRLALRQPADERPFEAWCEGQEPQVVWMEDVSRGGIRFRSQCAFACGSTITVSAPESFRIDPVMARVVRVQMVDPMMPERGFEYGAEYVVLEERPHAWYLATRAKR